MTFSICLHTPLIQSYCRLPVRLPVFWGSPFNTRSIPHYRLSSSVAQLCLQSRCHFVTPNTHTPTTHTTHTHRHTHTHKCQLRSIGHVGCLFRKCPPFNTPRYPPVQYLPFNTPVQYPIEQKAAAYPPGTGGFDTYPYFAIQKCFSHVSSISPCRPTLLLSKAFVR